MRDWIKEVARLMAKDELVDDALGAVSLFAALMAGLWIIAPFTPL